MAEMNLPDPDLFNPRTIDPETEAFNRKVEELISRMPPRYTKTPQELRQERGTVYYMVVRHRAAFRTFTHSRGGNVRNPRRFVLSHTLDAFVLLPTLYRTFTHVLSYFHTRPSRNRLCVSKTCERFSMLNTESNPYLTP